MAGAARFERAIDMTQAEREMVLRASCPGYAEQHFRNVPHALRGIRGFISVTHPCATCDGQYRCLRNALPRYRAKPDDSMHRPPALIIGIY